MPILHSLMSRNDTMKKAIVAGATGVIGTALVNELVSNGIEVLVLLRPNSTRKDVIISHPQVSILECSMSEYANLQNNSAQSYDVFFDLAWAGAAQADRMDMHLQLQNIVYALEAVRLAKRFGCTRFVGIGSQAEYGRCDGKMTPQTPCNPENGYGYAKLCAGYMTRDLAHQLGLQHIWVRVLSVYGPTKENKSMIMSTIAKLQSGEVPPFTKGEQIWDFLYSGDAANALRLLGERGIDGKTYVLGNGDARPLREYIEIIRDLVAPSMPLTFGGLPYAPNQVMYLCADTTELEKDTGWKPVTTFEEGIKQIQKSKS